MGRALKYLLFVLVLGTLWMPISNKMFKYVPAWPLNGSYETLTEPEFSWEEWFEGTYQEKAEPWFNEKMSIREYLVRFRNQYYFSVFKEAKANGVAPAKNGVLLDVEYVQAFYGTDFAGEDFLTEKLERWKRVQYGLDSIGVKAFLAFAPGKGSFFEEDFSDFLKDTHQPTTNYKFISEWCSANEVRSLDLKKIYHCWSDTSIYPLFPKGGIHWTDYGVAHVCDTLRGYIQHVTGKPLQKFWFDIEVSDTARDGDNDIAVGMNLLYTPNKQRLAYPIRYFGEDPEIGKTKLLTIADSYYYGIVYSGFSDRICSFGGFWYYFKETYPSKLFRSKNVEELDILLELKKQDVLMLMMTEPQLKRLGWGSIEKLEELLYPPKTNLESPS
ncbi:MAG: hypothetical protein ACI9UR_002142 [Bacteroidia bacterium]|jgi:hypothetical protein